MRIALFFAVTLLCFLTAMFAEAQPPIRLGLLSATPTVGKALEAGVRLYLQAAPQILGRPVELVMADTENKPERAVREAWRLVETEKVIALVGALTSGSALPVSLKARDAKVPYLETLAQIDDLTTTQRHNYVFRVNNSASAEGRLAARFLERQSLKTIGTVTWDAPASRAMMANVVSELKRLARGVSVTVERVVSRAARDTAADAAAIKAKAPDAVVIALPPDLTMEFQRVATDMGAFDSTKLRLFLGRAVQHAPVGAMADDDNDEHWDNGCTGDNCDKILTAHRAYIRLARERAPEYAGDGIALHGYLAMAVIAEAIQSAKSVDSERIARALPGLVLRSSPLGQLTLQASTHELDRGLFFGRVVSTDHRSRTLAPDAVYVIPRDSK